MCFGIEFDCLEGLAATELVVHRRIGRTNLQARGSDTDTSPPDEEAGLPFGSGLKFLSRIFCAIAISTPSNVKLERARWKIRSTISHIVPGTPSSSEDAYK